MWYIIAKNQEILEGIVTVGVCVEIKGVIDCRSLCVVKK